MNEEELEKEFTKHMDEFIKKLDQLHEKLLVATPEERSLAINFLKKMTRLNADIRPE